MEREMTAQVSVRISKKGFTLIELLIVIGILAILIAAVVVAINPKKQFAQARNTTRQANTTAIVTAIYGNLIENGGIFVCASGPIPSVTTPIKSGSGGYDLCPCIIPEYLPILVTDPSTGEGEDCTSYDMGYEIVLRATGRISISAPEAERGRVIAATY